jgi:hypothetical protein
MGVACSTHIKDEKLKKIMGKPEGKRPLGNSTLRW